MTEMVAIRGGNLAVQVFEPKIWRADALLIHGFTGSKEDFSLIGPLLAASGYRVVTSDNRGQHESEHSPDTNKYSIESLAQDHFELAKHFGLENPHLFGHSFGGLVAQRAAVEYSKLWRSVTLFCTGPHGMAEWSGLQGDIDYLATHTLADLWVKNGESQKPGNEKGSLKQRRWFASDKESLIRHAQHLMHEPSRVSDLREVGIPVNVIRGENDDAWPHDLQAQMAAELNAQVVVIDNAGHCPNEDQPELTAAAIVDFWDRHN